jgi:small subunit ribosomal protein S2
LIDAGIHFGHRVSRWNPKMKPYILTRRNSIHIIDPKETLRGLMAARKFFAQLAAEGKDVLLVGTKRQARKTVETNAVRVGMHYVNERWLGGMLTNFPTIRLRLTRLETLEKLEADGLMAQHSKKEDARLRREMRKIKRNLEGVRNMNKLPGAIFVVDASREVIALREARKLGIPSVALIDSDSDPDTVDIPIPGNDDAMRAIMLVTKEICDAIEIGKLGRTDKAEVSDVQSAPSEPAAPAPVEQPAVEAKTETPQPPQPQEPPAAPADETKGEGENPSA